MTKKRSKRVRKFSGYEECVFYIKDIMEQIIEMLSFPKKGDKYVLPRIIISGQSIRDAPKRKIGPTFMPEIGLHLINKRCKEYCYAMIRSGKLMLRFHKPKGLFSARKGYGTLFNEIKVDPSTYPILTKGEVIEKTYAKRAGNIRTRFGFYPHWKEEIRFLVTFNGQEKNCVLFENVEGRFVISKVELDITTIPEGCLPNTCPKKPLVKGHPEVKAFHEMFPTKRNAISGKPLMHAIIIYKRGVGWRLNTKEYSFDPTERNVELLKEISSENTKEKVQRRIAPFLVKNEK